MLNDAEGNFKFNSTSLPDDAKAKIDDMIKGIMADPKGAYFEIEGHTDNVGPADINQKIGLDRADSVKRYLYEQYQIPLHRINVISYGADKPVAPNTTQGRPGAESASRHQGPELGLSLRLRAGGLPADTNARRTRRAFFFSETRESKLLARP